MIRKYVHINYTFVHYYKGTKQFIIDPEIEEYSAQLGMEPHEAIMWVYNRAYNFSRHILSVEVTIVND